MFSIYWLVLFSFGCLLVYMSAKKPEKKSLGLASYLFTEFWESKSISSMAFIRENIPRWMFMHVYSYH